MSEFTYKTVFTRRRSLSIVVSPHKGVIVRAPYGTSQKTIEAFVKEKSGWIKGHLEGFAKLKKLRHDKNYSEGEIHTFLGRNYKLKLISSPDHFVRLQEETIEVGLKDVNDKRRVMAYLEGWYYLRADEIARRKMHEILVKFRDYRFSPTKLAVKPLKSRWGSCTSSGKITLNYDPVKLDEIYMEYVIIHELCHLRHHNHGKEFYWLLSMLFPDWKRVRTELRKYIR